MGVKKKKIPEETFGERLRRLRQIKGLTQADLGQAVSLSRRMVAYYEIQGGEPRPELLVKLAEVLGVSVDVLTGFREIPKKAATQQPEPHLWRRLKRIEELPLHDRKTILKMIVTMADARQRAK